MSYKGDFAAGDAIDFKFTTRQASGAPFTLGGSPVISVYKSNSTTESTAGVTLTADFDSRTGMNHVNITTALDATFYADGGQYEAVITTGTVNSVSVVGECVGRFTVRGQAGLYPTTSGRKLDVSAGGEAGLDWANVGSPTTTLALTGTTIAVTQKVDVDTIKTNPVVNAGTITFPTTATLASTTNITAGTIATVTNLTNAPSAGDFTATMKTSLSAATPAVTVSDKTGFSLTSAYDPAKTAAQAGNAMSLTSGERNSVADALLDRTDGVETGVTVRKSLRLANSANGGKDSGLAGTTVRIRDLADTKDRITATVDSDGNRSAITLDLT